MTEPKKPPVKHEPRACPFCNGKPGVHSSPTGFKVYCEDPDCRVMPETGRTSRRTTAIAYWNGVAPPRSDK